MGMPFQIPLVRTAGFLNQSLNAGGFKRGDATTIAILANISNSTPAKQRTTVIHHQLRQFYEAIKAA